MTKKLLACMWICILSCSGWSAAQDAEPLWENASFDPEKTIVEEQVAEIPESAQIPSSPEAPGSHIPMGGANGGLDWPKEIKALAANLDDDPVRIFNYVRNEINYEHYEGQKKGALLTLLEGCGNDYDQCSLFYALVCAARNTGYDDDYRIERVAQVIDYDDLKDWIGLAEQPYPGKTYYEVRKKTITTDFPNGSDKGVGDKIAKQALFAQTFFQTRGSIANYSSDGFPQKARVKLRRYFLTKRIVNPETGELSYLRIDPSFKRYTPIIGTENVLDSAKYDKGKLLALAGGGMNQKYALNLKQQNIEDYLANITTNLLEKIRDSCSHKSVFEFVGGRKIVKREINELGEAFELPATFSGSVSAYTLANVQSDLSDGSVMIFAADSIPESAKSYIELRIDQAANPSGYGPRQTMGVRRLISNVAGRKLSMDFEKVSGVLIDPVSGSVIGGPAVNRVNLRLDDGAPIGSVEIGGDTFSMTITATMPGVGSMSETKAYKASSGNAYAIIYGFSSSGKLLQKRNERLARYLENGLDDSSRQVRSELLNIMGLTWMYQVELENKLLASQNGVISLAHHRIGRMGQEEGFYVDVGLARSSSVADDGGTLSNSNRVRNVFHLGSMFASAMEHGIIEQMQPGSSAVSTVEILRNANRSGHPLYLAKSGNWSWIKSNLFGYSDSQIAQFNNYITKNNAKIFLPGSRRLIDGSWAGSGWVLRSAEFAGMIIDGTYKMSGGYSTSFGTVSSPSIWESSFFNPTYREPSYTTISSNVVPSYSTPRFYGSDPVNMATGAFEYSHTDLETGLEAAPRGLSFSRSYSSGMNLRDEQHLGFGWSHSMYIRAAKRTATEEALGLGTVEQAASFIIASLVAADLYREDATPQEWGTAAITVGWFVDRMKNNAVAVHIGSNSFQFIKQPDGSWQAPAGSTMNLEVKADGLRVGQQHGNLMIFEKGKNPKRSLERIKSIVDPDGAQMDFKYLDERDEKGKLYDRIDSITDSHGRKYKFKYEGSKIVRIVDSTNSRGVDFKYDSVRNLLRATDPEGKFTYYDYTAGGSGTEPEEHRMAQMRNHDGDIITLNVYDSLGRVKRQLLHGNTAKSWKLYYTGSSSTEVDPNGGATTYFYDERGRSVGKRDALGNHESWKYDGQDRIVERVSGAQEKTTWEYDADHNVTWIHHPRGGGDTEMRYDSLNRLDLVIDPDGRRTNYVYNSGNKKARPDRVEVTYQGAICGITTYEYESTSTDSRNVGRVSMITDKDGLVTEFKYDANGHPDWTKIHGFKTDFTYSTTGDLMISTDPRLIQTAWKYNKRRQVTKVTLDQGGASEAVQDFTYDNQGLLSRTTNAPDNNGQRFVTRQRYSPTEKPTITQTSDEDGIGANDPKTEIRYDLRDWQKEVLDPSARTTTFIPRENGQLFQTILPGNRIKSQTEDGDGRPVSFVMPGSSADRNSGFAYVVSSGGFPQTEITTADGLTTVETQDRSGRPRFYKNRLNHVWEFRYDGLGRRSHVITPLDADSGRAQVTEYHQRGAVKSVTEPSGQRTDFSYGPTNGRLEMVNDPVGRIEHTLYDENGNLKTTTERRYGASGSLGPVRTTNRTYDRQNRLLSRTDENGQTIGYRYYPSGKLAKVIYPGGSENGTGHVEYQWWKSGNLKKVIDRLDSITTPRVTSYEWNSDGRLKKIIRPNKTIREIKYDAVGRPEIVEEYGPGNTLIFVHKHGYYPSDEMKWRYELPKGADGTVPAMKAMTYNADNQLRTWNGMNVVHDADGNMTSGPAPDPGGGADSLVSYAYDARNRLTSTLGANYTYDCDSQRIGMTKDGVSTTYAVDAGTSLSKVLVRTKGGVSTRYVWGLGLIYEVNGSGSSASTVTYHYDATGTTRALTNDDPDPEVIERISYTPFGQIQSRVNVSGTLHDTPFLFTGFFGNQTDGNGLLYMRARYYHPRLGRFLNADPARDGWNWYGYAGGNPVGFVDPMGLGIEGALDSVQTTLSFLGMIPVYGAVFDMVNTGISIGRGNYADAAVNFASAVPGLGDLAGGAKLLGAGAAAYGTYRGVSSITHSFGVGPAKVGLGWKPTPFNQCFPAGTMILMADGTTKPIEEIVEGDVVVADDPEDSSPPCQKQVTHLHRNWTQRFIHVAVDTDTDGTADCEIRATGEHPFWIINRGWVAAKDLTSGDALRTPWGDMPRVVSAISIPEVSYTYNLTVQGAHTFFAFVGHTPILVHNTDPFEIRPFGEFPTPRGNLSTGVPYQAHELLQNAWLKQNGYLDFKALNPSLATPTTFHQQVIFGEQASAGLHNPSLLKGMSAYDNIRGNIAVLKAAGVDRSVIADLANQARNFAKSLPCP